MEIDKIISIITGVIGISITVIKFILDFNKDYRQNKRETNNVGKKQVDLDLKKASFLEKISIFIRVKIRQMEGFWFSFLAPVSLVLFLTILWQFFLYFLAIEINVSLAIYLLLFNLIVIFLLLEGWIFFFSHFLFPLQNPIEIVDVYKSLKKFMRNFEVRIVRIKNGLPISKIEGKKNGYDIVMVDKTSAVVVRTETQDDIVIGSGVKILRPSEYVVGSVDLRTQLHYIGPVVFDNTIPDPKFYNELQKRRKQTSGSTLDGFEVSPIISIKFKIMNELSKDRKIIDNSSSLKFDPDCVRKAVSRELVQLSAADNKNTRMDWRKLPAYLVVNLWREYVNKFKIEDLFKSEGISGLQTIEDMINKRVTRPNVLVLDKTGLPTGDLVASFEYQQLLSCGLEVLEVHILNVMFEPFLELQIIKNWQSELENFAKREEMLLRNREKSLEINARKPALKRFTKITVRNFHNPIANPGNIYATLQDLIQPLRDFLLLEGSSEKQSESDIKKLDEIWKWLLVHNIDESAKNRDDA